MSVIVKEVISKKDLKRWVDFPNKMYKKCKPYCPFLFPDEVDTFTRAKNPAYEFCETKLYLAYKGKKIVGRIAGLINHVANKKWNTSTIRFTRFDFIDDYEVSSALFNKVVEWGRMRGYDSVLGPMGFTDMDHSGSLIDGFNELNLSITFYNYPYYTDHYMKLGLQKEVDWVEYQVYVPEKIDEKYEKIANYLKAKSGFELVEYTDRKTLMTDAYEAFKVIDVAFSVLYGTVPLTEAVIDKAIKDYIPIVNLKYICSIKDKEGKIAGFAVMVPSIAKALKKSNGKLLPFGLFRLLKALKGKNDVLEMYFVAVKPEYQSKGLPAIMMNHLMKVCRDNGVKLCETGPELDHNDAVQSLWKGLEVRKHRRRRAWKKEI